MAFELCCSRCGRPVPSDPAERALWEPDVLLGGELDELTARMLLCPDCAREERTGEVEAGEGN